MPQRSTSSPTAANDVTRLRPVGSAARTTNAVKQGLVVSPCSLNKLQGAVASRGRSTVCASAEGEAVDETSGSDWVNESQSPKRHAQPEGLEGLEDDESLFELVGHDYGMMAMLRSDKFKSLIVFLRNIPQREWVDAVAKEYGDDDQVKKMVGQIGKLMHMQQYYENQKRRMEKK